MTTRESDEIYQRRAYGVRIREPRATLVEAPPESRANVGRCCCGRMVSIPRLECGSAGSCGGDQFGKDGLTEITVDGKFWGLVHWGAGSHFAISYDDGDGWEDLGWRKNRETARKAAIKTVRRLLRNNADEPRR